MAHFYANIQGGKGEATRTGHKTTGIYGHIRGGSAGVKVVGKVDKHGRDAFEVIMTHGSWGPGIDKKLGEVVDFTKEYNQGLYDQKVYWFPEDPA